MELFFLAMLVVLMAFALGSGFPVAFAGVTNFRGIYWEVERDTLIAIPLFVFMGIMLQRSKIAEDLLVTMAQLFGRCPAASASRWCSWARCWPRPPASSAPPWWPWA
jgi:TRAP-type mannitol/chloroaromatic compound transport system permease large subunit